MKRLELNIKCCAECPYSRRGDVDTLNCYHDDGPKDYFLDELSVHTDCPLPDVPGGLDQPTLWI